MQTITIAMPETAFPAILKNPEQRAREMRIAAAVERDEEMKPEYDLSKMKGGVRGKYYKALQEGHTVEIVQEDGSRQIHCFRPEEGAVVLDPDVREYFPDSESVNRALRSLIALIPAKQRAAHSR